MDITCVSDLHGHYPHLEGGDLLIVAGDLTMHDLENENALFDYWLKEQNYKKKIVIAGNHDCFLEEFGLDYFDHTYLQFADYLCDSGTEFEGLKIWGSPWTKRFEGMNPNCMAFTVDTEEELAEKWALIPDDVDILVTHSPPWTILDYTTQGKQAGSTSLMGNLIYSFRPKLLVFGHIHEDYGQEVFKGTTICVNASHVNERYEPVNKPIRIIL